jgi:hypothetical protein
VLAQPLDVSDQVMGRVGRQVSAEVAGVRRAVAAAALIELDEPIAGRIELPPSAGPAAAARPAVQRHRGLAVRISGGLPVDTLPIADLEHTRGKRLDWRVWRDVHADHPTTRSR